MNARRPAEILSFCGRPEEITAIRQAARARKKPLSHFILEAVANFLRAGGKIPVTYVGEQPWPNGDCTVLVNEPNGSTVVFDPARHELPNWDAIRLGLKGTLK